MWRLTVMDALASYRSGGAQISFQCCAAIGEKVCDNRFDKDSHVDLTKQSSIITDSDASMNYVPLGVV